MSVEEKIVRAQQKVRQRAEKRRQEYDKNLLLSQEHNDDIMKVNNELTLQVPQLIATSSESPNTVTPSGEDNTKFQHDENIQTNALKAPVHQEHALDNSSEMEISHESGTPNNSDKKDGSDHIVTSKGENDTSTVTTEENDAQSRNKIKNDNAISLPKVADTVTIENPDNNLDIAEPIVGVAVDIGSDKSVTDGQSNANEEVSKLEEDNAKVEERALNVVDRTNSTLGPDENVLKENENLDNTENHTLNAPNIINNLECHNNDDSIKSTTNNNDVEVNVIAQNASDTHVIVVDTNLDDQKQVSNGGIINAKELPLPTNIENEPTVTINVQTNNEQPKHNSNATQELNMAKDVVETQNDDNTKLQSDTATNGLSVHNSNDQQIEKTEIQQLKLNEEANEEPKEATQSSILESDDAKEKLKRSTNAIKESEAALPPTNVNKDTLITENMENKINKDDELKIATSSNNITAEDMPPSQVDKQNTVLDKVTSDNEDVYDNTPHDAQNNSTDSIINFSSANTHNTETHLEGTNKSETSDNINENTQNDNHDAGNMDLETAAITIQKVFRTFLFKSRGSTFEDTGNNEGIFLDEDDKNKVKYFHNVISIVLKNTM